MTDKVTTFSYQTTNDNGNGAIFRITPNSLPGRIDFDMSYMYEGEEEDSVGVLLTKADLRNLINMAQNTLYNVEDGEDCY
jgi:hypothetical protein